jgi:hypothetical protein
MEKLTQHTFLFQTKATFVESTYLPEDTIFPRNNDSIYCDSEIINQDEFLRQKSEALSPINFDEPIVFPKITLIPASVTKAALVIFNQTALSKISELNI